MEGSDKQPKLAVQIPPSTPPLVVIVGPTASGKTALAIDLAKQFNGEIICADSRTVYAGMDIGTAKPTEEERAQVPHHLLDIVKPDETFTAADFKRRANEAIAAIAGRGKLPIMVGGSGLYIDAVLFDYGFAAKDAPRDQQNPRHLAESVASSKRSLRKATLVIGLQVERSVLKRRIEKRIDVMVASGLIDEVRWLLESYPNSKALQAPGYKAFSKYLAGNIDLGEAKAAFARNDYQLAKRQMTWFKRNETVQWLSNSSDATALVRDFLNKKRV